MLPRLCRSVTDMSVPQFVTPQQHLLRTLKSTDIEKKEPSSESSENGLLPKFDAKHVPCPDLILGELPKWVPTVLLTLDSLAQLPLTDVPPVQEVGLMVT